MRATIALSSMISVPEAGFVINMSKAYLSHPELRHLVLEDSYVLGLAFEARILTISASFLLSESHPKWSPFTPPRYGCYRSGTIRFEKVIDLKVVAIDIFPSYDTDHKCDLGCIDDIDPSNDGRIKISADFGVLEFSAEKFSVALKS